MMTLHDTIFGGVGGTLCLYFLFVLMTARVASALELPRASLFNKLLVVLDTHRFSHSQLDFTLYVARQLGATLTVRFVLRPHTDQKATTMLTQYVAEKAEEVGVCVRSQRGQFKDVLKHLVTEHSPDCVLMGQERFSWFSLPKGYTLPTLVMPRQPKERLEDFLMPFENTPESFEALDKASQLAQTFRARLHPVHFLELPSAPPKGARAWMYVNREEVAADFARERERLKHRAKNLLFKVRQDFPGVAPELYETSSAERYQALETIARKQNTDLIVVGNTELGKVSRQFVRHLATRTPVLIL